MDQLDTATAATKLQSSAASLTSALGNNFNPTTSTNTVFAHLLAQDSGQGLQRGKSLGANVTGNLVSKDGSTAAHAMVALNKVITALQHVLKKLSVHNDFKSSTDTQAKQTAKNNAQDTASHEANNISDNQANAAPTTPPLPQPASANTTSDQTASTKAPDDQNDDNDPTSQIDAQTLAEVAAQIQNLLQAVERKLQAASDLLASSTEASAPVDATSQNQNSSLTAQTDPNQLLSPTSNLDNASAQSTTNDHQAAQPQDPLAELALLAEAVQKKIDALANQFTASASPAATNTKAVSASGTGQQIKETLQTLLASLKTQSNQLADANPAANDQASQDVSVNSSSNAAPTTAPSAHKDDSFLQNNVISLVRNDFRNPEPTFAPLTTNQFVAANDTGDTSLDLDLNSQGNGASTTAKNAAGAVTNLPLGNETNSTTSPYNFASQLSAARATNGGATGLPSAIEQAVVHLHRSVKDGNDQMTLQLRPAELGRIDIKLNFLGDGKVQGMVVADNPATLDLLLKDVRSLERALQDAGLRADPGSLQFSLGGQSGQSSGQMTGDNQKSTNSNQGLADRFDVAGTVSSDEIWYVTPGRVNLKV